MPVKADQTKLLLKLYTLKLLREGSCSLLEIEIERTVCEVSSRNHDHMHVLAVGVLEITITLER